VEEVKLARFNRVTGAVSGSDTLKIDGRRRAYEFFGGCRKVAAPNLNNVF
jgi:hypothetical protein